MDNQQTLVRFNVQNVKYSLPLDNKKFSNFLPYGTATKLALSSDFAAKKIYGDGRVICVYANDKNQNGTLTFNNVNDEFEIAMARKIRTAQGIAQIKQNKNVTCVIYFETCGIKANGEYPIAKTMLYCVSTQRPAETFDQTTDDINESTFEMPIEIAGVTLKESDGVTDFKNSEGRTLICYQMTVTPDDPDFETFGEGAPVFPTMPANAKNKE